MNQPRVAVLIPCYNESVAISRVVADFKSSMPAARIYVYDNNSNDGTAKIAAEAGAIVRHEWQQGKGAVVRRMFRDIEADFYIMVDGDHTYDAALAPQLMALALETRSDLVNAVRKDVADDAYRAGHRLGNVMLTGAVRKIFGDRAQDMLSGYKVFSRRFVKSFPSSSIGFGIETELTVHALELQMPMGHLEGEYCGRLEGSVSKLNTYSDGVRILWLICQLFKHERPMAFFSVIGAVFVAGSIALGIPLINEYLHTGLVPRFPTAILATGVMLLGMLSFVTGLILDTVTRGRREMKMLAYLSYPFYEG
jgi:glycosyltransferase involved in cell wall biosynthesis